MNTPEQRLFEADCNSAAFLAGVARGRWGLAPFELVPETLVWPHRVVWLGAAKRSGAPDRYYVLLDLTGYRNAQPTGTFWDPETKATSIPARRPRGTPGSRFAKVFRTDWENGRAFYHPYDRVAATSHPAWPTEQPHLIWDCQHTIVDYLEEFSSLLYCGDYLGLGA